MGRTSKIDSPLRQAVYIFCMQEVQRERQGSQADLDFMLEDFWLKDTAVSEYVMKRKGMWEIHLIFAWYTQPLQFIKRKITSVSSRRKAEFTASIMRRQAAKDVRGTLEVNPTLFNTSLN